MQLGLARACGAPQKYAARLVFVVNVDWFFLSHRLPIALRAQALGAQVTVMAGDTGQGHLIQGHGFDFVPLPIVRRGRTIRSEARTLWALLRAYKEIRPDLVHHVTLQPILYGSIAARVVCRRAAVVNAVAGLGYALSLSTKKRGFERAVRHVLPHVLSRRGSIALFQNCSDRDYFVAGGGLRPEQTALIRGSGVDLDEFAPSPLPSGPPMVLFASRMLWSKGVGEFVEAATNIRRYCGEIRFVMAGESDENPESVTPAQLLEWQELGVVEWLGRVNDMASLIRQSSLVVLPTYYPEGVPKVLLEAAASARAIVATDTPGCREIVLHGHNGLLIPLQDPAALEKSIVLLLESRENLLRYGLRGRDLAASEFGVERVVSETHDIYRRLLPSFPDAQSGGKR